MYNEATSMCTEDSSWSGQLSECLFIFCLKSKTWYIHNSVVWYMIVTLIINILLESRAGHCFITAWLIGGGRQVAGYNVCLAGRTDLTLCGSLYHWRMTWLSYTSECRVFKHLFWSILPYSTSQQPPALHASHPACRLSNNSDLPIWRWDC